MWSVLQDEVNGSASIEQFMSQVFHCCPNLEEVIFQGYQAPLTKWGIASSFFREHAANLPLIYWDCEEDEKGFPDLRKCLKTRCVSSYSFSTAALLSLLTACGSALEQLSISIKLVGDGRVIIEALRKHSKNLSTLKIVNLKDVIDIVGQESYSSVIR